MSEKDKIKTLLVKKPLKLDCGQTINDFPLAYETYGKLNDKKDNAILVFHALTGDQFASGSRTRVKQGRLQIRNWTVSYNDTAFFVATVTPQARSTSTTTFTGTIVGTGLAGTVNLEDGSFTFAVQSRNEGLVIGLTNDSHLPSNFVNAEWEGYYESGTS